MHPYSSTDSSTVWKKLRFILLDRSNLHVIDSLLIAIHVIASHVLKVIFGWWDAASKVGELVHLFQKNTIQVWLVGCLGFYGISTFVGYLIPNPFLCK